MAGIYIHIPFCRRQCNYCDFHFTVSLKNREKIVSALVRELMIRSGEAGDTIFNTLYFGGGTPSILSIEELKMIISAVFGHYRFDRFPEITLETNPDDLSMEYLKWLAGDTPVNRLSIGVQSFNNRDLQLLNRIHDSDKAIEAIEMAKNTGFTNLNIDLIYAIPGLTDRDWANNLETFKKLDIPHLSAYELTVEPHTVFAFYKRKGRIVEKEDDEKINQFLYLMDFASREGYEHYEISNYAKAGFESRHNLGYWTGEPYLGFGPSAHSYSGTGRRWNIANNTLYLENMESGKNTFFETEAINPETAFNEFVMTSLRTMWGIDTEKLKLKFGSEKENYLVKVADKFIKTGKLISSGNHLCLSRDGKLLADYIISELMIV